MDGVLTCDPNLVPDAHPCEPFHSTKPPNSPISVQKSCIPPRCSPPKKKIFRCGFSIRAGPEAPGTKIVAEAVPCSNILKSVACKTGRHGREYPLDAHAGRHGFLRRIFEIFDRYETSVDMVATSEVSVSLTVDNDTRLPEICAELEPFTEVTIERTARFCAPSATIFARRPAWPRAPWAR